MVDQGFEPDFPPDALKQLANLHEPTALEEGSLKDLSHLLWCSIDNDDSRDLDQLSVGENLPENRLKIYVAVADADELGETGDAAGSPREKRTRHPSIRASKFSPHAYLPRGSPLI